ncbi:MAG TPA: hypothetical protein VM657_08630 [Sphingomonas sp.]|nr:hypothetical protein [Sphingomonas sp.]
MKPIWIALGAGSLLTLGACADQYGNDGYYGPGYYNQAPAGSYDAYRHYRNDRRYREHRLSREDRIYRGSDGRYYCKRDDGTTGLIVGALGGGVLGNIIAPGGSELLGTLLGAGAGALAGQAIDKGDAKCR